jgi:hypothetical protein
MKRRRPIQLPALLAALGLAAAGTAYAQVKKAEVKKEGHCEKMENGKDVDVDPPADVKDPKAWCKEQGGKWQKGAKHDEHK